MKFIFLLIGICLVEICSGRTLSDTLEFPELGKVCPDFKLTDVEYYPQKQVAVKDFRGKWLVLDFWNWMCGACIASFPKTNALQKEFGDKVQFMLVGMEGEKIDKDSKCRAIYGKFRKAEKLAMPCAFDSVLWKRFDIWTCPHLIIIDDHGVVRGVTNSVVASDLHTFLAGGIPNLPTTYRYASEEAPDERIPYNPKRAFLIHGNGADDSDFLFRSVLTVYKPAIHNFWSPDSIGVPNIKSGRFEALGVPLYQLYNFAYLGVRTIATYDSVHFGKYRSEPLLEIRDSSLFQYSYRAGENLFSYSLIMPKVLATKTRLEGSMRRDLENYFGYDVKIEEREDSCWILLARQGTAERLRTSSGTIKAEFTHVLYSARNYPFKKFWLDMLRISKETIVDETGIGGNIDITMGGALDYWDDLKKALEENGFELRRGVKKMKVLVIKDRGHNN